ncbi:MAG: leucine-rich repeat protein, partial [Clostridia bacterium]|nr:leucine-rich repeat protein [Clostridia bacterium]
MKRTYIIIIIMVLIPVIAAVSILAILRKDAPAVEESSADAVSDVQSGAESGEESAEEEPVSLYGCPHRADWIYFESDFDEHGNGTMLYRCDHCGSDLAKRALYRTPEGVVYYVDENGDYALCGINKEAKETVIPAAVNGRTVAGVDLISSGVGHVYLPATIEYITDKALNRIPYLSHYSLDPANPYYTLTETCLIDKRTKTLLIGNAKCVIPSDGSVTKIGDNALKNVESVYIPACVTEISGLSYVYSFNGTSDFTVDEANDTYVFKNGCLINKKTKTLVFVTKGYELPADGSVTRIGDYAFYNKDLNESELFLPACIEYIGEGAFKNLKVTKLTIESLDAWFNVEFAGINSAPLAAYERRTSSERRAAYLTDGTEITVIEVPESVTHINDYAFCGWNSVSEIKFHDGVTYIGKQAFDGCWIRELTLPERVKELGEAAFASANLKTLHLPEGIVYIGEQCFANCRFDSVTADFENNGFIKLKNGCVIDFAEKTLLFTAQEFAIPDDRSVIRIAEKACYRTDAKSIIIPDSVEYIGANAFESCMAESVVIPDSVIYIGDNAF